MVKIEQTGEKSIAVGINKGDIHIHYGDKKIPAYLTMPPLNTEVFEGRETALLEVHDLLFGGNNLLMLVNGQGGIGKTTFAAKYWKKYEKEYKYLAFLYVGDGIAGALLQTEFTNNLGINFPEKIIDEEKLKIVFEFLATKLDKPCLLILDNANDAEDLGKYAVALGKCSNFHILLTSRLANFENMYPYPLGALDKVVALKVFQKHYEFYEPTDETLFYEIFEAVGGNTLVMELLAKNLNNFNRNKQNYSLQNLHEDLKKSLLNLSKSKEVNTAYQAQGTGLRNEKPEVIILAMYDLSELREAEIALLSAFAVLPPENIAFASLETLLNSETLEDSLETLTQKGWIEFDKTTKSYKVSPVVQEITRYKNKERLFGDCEKLVGVLIEKLDYQTTHLIGSSYEDGIKYCYYAESVVLVDFTNFRDLLKNYNVGVLCQRIGYFHQITGKLNKALIFYEREREIYENLLNQNPTNVNFKNALAVSYSYLGQLNADLGDLNKAIDFFERDIQLLKQFYEKFPNNIDFKYSLAISYSKLGQTNADLGLFNEALNYFEIGTKLFQELCEKSPTDIDFKNGLATFYEKLGNTHNDLGNLENAFNFYKKMNFLLKQLCANNPTNVSFESNLAISYSRLGESYTYFNDLTNAYVFIEIAKNLFKELNDNYSNNIHYKNALAYSYSKLGDIYIITDKEKAQNYYLESQKLLAVLVQTAPNYAEFQKNLEWVENRLAGL